MKEILQDRLKNYRQTLSQKGNELLEAYRPEFVEQFLDGIIDFFKLTSHLEYVKGMDNIKRLKEKIYDVENDRYIPTIFAFHHVDKPELFWVTRLALDLYGGDSTRLVYPVSVDYSDPSVYCAYAVAVGAGKYIGDMNIYPIKQAYWRRQGIIISESDKMKLKKRDRKVDREKGRDSVMDLRFIRELRKDFIKGKCLIIAPAGHRSTDGGLLPAENGVGMAIEVLNGLIATGKIEKALIVPVGINILGRKYPDPRERFGMVIGKPLTPKEIIKNARELVRLHDLTLQRDRPTFSQLAHALMLEMAELVENKGVYNLHHELFGGVIRDEVRLGIDNNGYVGLININ